MNERETDRQRMGSREKGQKVERKDTRSSMFGNCNKIYYSSLWPKFLQLSYAPVTSCDVQGSFSMFKNVLSDKRMSLNEDNLEKLVVV